MIKRFALLISFTIFFTKFADAVEYDGLVVHGDYRELPVYCIISPNQFGISQSDLIKAVKLKLFSNNMTYKKASLEHPHHLQVICDIVETGNAFSFKISLMKSSKDYVDLETHFLGSMVKPQQGEYGGFGTIGSRSQLIDHISTNIESFLLDYLESNINTRKFFEELLKNQAEQSAKQPR